MRERHVKGILTLIFTSPTLNLILYLSYNTHLAVSLARLVTYTLCRSWWLKKSKFGSLKCRRRIKGRRVYELWQRIVSGAASGVVVELGRKMRLTLTSLSAEEKSLKAKGLVPFPTICCTTARYPSSEGRSVEEDAI
jgi:hypothetical protein